LPTRPQIFSHGVKDRYAGGAERPLGTYGLFLSVYGGLIAGMTFIARRRHAALPERMPLADLALLTVATHKLSRLIAKDSVTAVLRAPFTHFEEAAGAGEVNESVVGRGVRHGVGELITCPFCLSVWIASIVGFGLVVAPRLTRLAMSLLAAVTGSDWLQYAYTALKQTE
jgi:hypothetical protein